MSSATVRVEKATSDLLIGPDWTMNIDICDSINSNTWDAKDVVKAVKKRLQHKNPKVQLLALTLLETMVKNCGDYVHFQIAEKNILQEMIKIVKKKTDMHVRDKILVLLDSWQEAFGGPGGKFPQYYWAYEELRRSGVEFPQRSSSAAPIFTPPVTHATLGYPQPGYGMPNNSSRRLDEAMASEVDSLSASKLDSMRNVMELLSDMLEAVNPSDRMAVKDEVIVDLVNQCRGNQKKLMQMLTSTADEELLGQGLELNDCLQSLVTKHDAIASGSPLPNISPPTKEAGGSSDLKTVELRDSSPRPNAGPSKAIVPVTRTQLEEEEEEDDFAQLARRHSKTQPANSGTPIGKSEVVTSPTSAIASNSNALALPDPPAPVRTNKEQDMIDLLSITLSSSSVSPHTPTPHTPTHTQTSATPPGSSNQTTSSTINQGYPYPSQPYPTNLGHVPYSSYVAPWAQPQPQPQQPQAQTQPQPHQPQYPSAYPPPPWASTPGFLDNRNSSSTNNRPHMSSPYMPMQGRRSLQQFNSLPTGGSNGLPISGVSSSPRNTAPSTGNNKPFIPSYRLFEDLNVLGNADKTGTSSSQSMVGGRK